ncbi:MAG: FAD-dependent thymidylate synthase [Planctomycetota bacterium]
MAGVTARVVLMDVTPNALDLIYAACRQCYSADFAADIAQAGPGVAEKAAFVRKIVASGHESPLEHVKFTFAVEGVSRALTHQLVRHRIASYSQQSQRYVRGDDFDFVVPPSIARDPAMQAEFIRVMDQIRAGYTGLIQGFKARGITGEAANQDARFVLPQAAETKIVVTMNARELIHFFSHRCCARAQWEIRGMADTMLGLCKAALPDVFGEAGAKCVALGYCPEGAKFTCGRYPLKADMLKREATGDTPWT